MLFNPLQFEILSEIGKFYELGEFHDLQIICGSPPDLRNPIWCHKLVIASVSPLKIGPVLSESDIEIGEPQTLFLPDFETNQVLSWVQDLYQRLKKKPDSIFGQEGDIPFDPMWAEFLGLNVGNSRDQSGTISYGDFGLRLKLKELDEDPEDDNSKEFNDEAYDADNNDDYDGNDMEEVLDGDIEPMEMIESVRQDDILLKMEPMIKIERLKEEEMLSTDQEPVLRKSKRREELDKIQEMKMLEEMKIRRKEERLAKKNKGKKKLKSKGKKKGAKNVVEKKDAPPPPPESEQPKKLFLDDREDFELFPDEIEKKIEMVNVNEDEMDPTFDSDDSDFEPNKVVLELSNMRMTNKKPPKNSGSKELTKKRGMPSKRLYNFQNTPKAEESKESDNEEFSVKEEEKMIYKPLKKKFKRSKKMPIVPKEESSEDEDVEPSLNIVYERFRETDNKINVTVDRTPICEDHINVFYSETQSQEVRKKRDYYRKMFFGKKNYLKRCLLGVRKILGKNTYECKPLVSGDMQKKHILGHFDKVLNLLRNKYGLSMKQMLMDHKILKKTNLGLNSDSTYNIGDLCQSLNLAQKVTKSLFEKYYELPIEELNWIKEDSLAKIDALDSRPEKSKPKTKVNILPGSNIDLILNENLSESDFDGFILLMWQYQPNNELFCHTINFERDESWPMFLIDIWSRKNKHFFSSSRTIHKKIKDIYELTRIPDVIDSIRTKAELEGRRDFSEKKFETKTIVCTDCGIEFPINTQEERNKYSSHKYNHNFENLRCGCNIKFANKKEKMIHMKLVHTENKNFVICEMCNEAVKEENLASHVETNHADFLCTECGFSVNDLYKYNSHVQKYHALKTCDECFLEFPGYYGVRKHKSSEHPQKMACDICGRVLVNLKQLSDHKRQMHSKPEDRPYICKFCSKSFIKKTMLQCHMINVHLKTRPFKCGYGCGMDYNDTSNRNSHEKKKHGGLFPSREPERLDDFCPIEIEPRGKMID